MKRHSQQGIALVITLIMLSVITFMAVTFLAVSTRERGSVTTANDQLAARLAADSALDRAKIQLVGTMLANTNSQLLDLLVSRNYISLVGFNNGSADPNPTNVNYDYEITGAPLSAGDFLRNLCNLEYDPRPPVYVTLNSGALDFRFYLDLNRNGQFDTNGFLPVIDQGNNPESINGVTVSNEFIGDPEWIGILANPLAPHSPTNRFVSRFAYFVAPAGKTLDLNHIHNEASVPGQTKLNASGADYLRDQGVGTWEINLAAFLADLNTNQWDPPTANTYQYDPVDNFITRGVAFQDAESIYSYRLGLVGNYTLDTAADVLNGAVPLVSGNGFYDAYDFGPLMTNEQFVYNLQPINKPWPGADTTNQSPTAFFTPGDLFDPTKTSKGFTNRLNAADGASDSYDRYTFYRLLAQMGTDTGPERGKLNVNYMNFMNTGSNYVEIPNSETNQFRWGSTNMNTPANSYNLNLFYDAADMLIRSYTTNWLAEDPPNFVQTFGISNAFSITNIPVWVSNRFVYTPSVHRLLQLAANICETTGTNRVFGPNGLATNFPNVFRPIFSKIQNGPLPQNYSVYITGYTNIEANSSFVIILGGSNYDYVPVFHDLYNTNPLDPLSIAFLPSGVMISAPPSPVSLIPGTPDMVEGVPLVIGARKGFPTFNAFSSVNVASVARHLEFRRLGWATQEDANDPANVITYTNQLYDVCISNTLSMDAWNSYSNPYPRNLTMIVTNFYGVGLNQTNWNGGPPLPYYWSTNLATSAVTNIPPYAWLGFPASSPTARQMARSLIVPFSNYFNFETNIMFIENGGGNAAISSPGFDTKDGVRIPVGLGQFGMTQWYTSYTNRLRYVLVDTDANRIVDYVSLVGQDPPMDLTTNLIDLSSGASINALGGSTGDSPVWEGDFWITNTPTPLGYTYGAQYQVNVSLAGETPGLSVPASGWINSTYGPNKDVGISVFYYNVHGQNDPLLPNYPVNTKSDIFEAPYVPYSAIYQKASLQANDPFVHYTYDDLQDLTTAVTAQRNAAPKPFLDVGFLNSRYQPWAVAKSGQGGASSPNFTWAPADTYVVNKDPLITRSDDWNFPTNVLPNVGWLGQIHRGTPWQTVYMKSWDVDTNQNDNLIHLANPDWEDWTGNPNPVDALRARPVEDWKIFDLFTTALNDNSTEGQLSVNQSGLAAWSAILSGVITLTNTTSDVNLVNGAVPATTPLVIQPAGNAGTNSPVGRIVTGINATRNWTNFGGTFQHVGDILATPELTIGIDESNNIAGSPYLNFDAAQRLNGIDDAMYERIPQQIMSLLRSGQTRFVIYSYGQTLRPAPKSIVTSSGQYFGLCTNYQITAEVATRAVVRVDNAPTPLNPNATPHIVIESFNILPPD